MGSKMKNWDQISDNDSTTGQVYSDSDAWYILIASQLHWGVLTL